MFLHLGADIVIPLANIISINDLKSVRSVINKNFIQNMRDKKKVINVSAEEPKSFIITDNMVYLSAISSLTLKKRAGCFLEHETEEEDDRNIGG
ncbi:MAG: DUF370 domain-containing protein [Veillonellales bacterium]